MKPVTHAKIAYWKFNCRIAPEILWMAVKITWWGCTRNRSIKNQSKIDTCIARSQQLFVDRKHEVERVYRFHKLGYELYIE